MLDVRVALHAIGAGRSLAVRNARLVALPRAVLSVRALGPAERVVVIVERALVRPASGAHLGVLGHRVAHRAARAARLRAVRNARLVAQPALRVALRARHTAPGIVVIVQGTRGARHGGRQEEIGGEGGLACLHRHLHRHARVTELGRHGTGRRVNHEEDCEK